jgi:biopolymer transport protein ExbD
MDVGAKKGGPKSDINVTPLVDVVLVLLIIFLVTMPIMMRQITVEVPRQIDDATEVIAKPSEQITVELGADGRISIVVGSSEETVSLAEVAAKLRPALEKKSGDKVVFVDADFEAPYGSVVALMDTVKGAGAEKVAVVDKAAKAAQVQ